MPTEVFCLVAQPEKGRAEKSLGFLKPLESGVCILKVGGAKRLREGRASLARKWN